VNDRERFERLVLPHLDSATNLARWLLRDPAAADDAVQEAALRALRHLGTLRGDAARPWLLGIVRNTCYTALAQRRGDAVAAPFDDDDDGVPEDTLPAASASEPPQRLDQARLRARIDAALRALPPFLREVIVLHELEELDVAAVARIIGAPAGTVMSRLSRARARLRIALAAVRT
jgi:RNA polymerase sigma-70 factor (ECF subfamily)